jgi:hypothetical protein
MDRKTMTGKFYLAKDLLYERSVQHCRVSSNLKTLVPKKKIYKGYYAQTKLYSVLLIWFMTIFVSVGHMVFTNCISLEQGREQEKEEDQQSYVNYTSFKFKVQFQYPTTWIQSEKITDKEKGSDIWVTNYSNKSSAVFWISTGNDTQLGSDLELGIKNLNVTLMNKYASKSYQTIEPPAISTIDGKIAATFIHTFVESMDGIRVEEVQQIWLVYVGTRDYYLIGFKAPSQLFAGNENSEALDNFIKSIKFLKG